MRDVKEITRLEDFLDAIGGSRTVVDFARRNGCVPCQRLEPHFKAAAASPVLDDTLFVKVLLDEVETDLLNYAMDRVGILGTPTVLEYRFGSVFSVVTERVAPKIVKELSNDR